MSYRELRDFSEIMRTLGYRRLISMDNFRMPNFELVADILYWLIHRYDPSVSITDDISTEQARVSFLQSAARIVMQKARVKLSIKQLYRADGYAVKELLKVCTLLYNATKVRADTSVDVPVLSAEQLKELKAMHGITLDIVDSGSKLYTLLQNEGTMKQQRVKALRFLDAMSLDLENNSARDVVDRAMRQQINVVADKVSQMQQMCTSLDEDQQALQAKIERKQSQIELTEKRLKSLKKVRPAFMEEYEAMEGELKIVYEEYVLRMRNLQYLESQLRIYRESEQYKNEQHQRALKRMQKRLKDEELRVLRGESDGDDSSSLRSRPNTGHRYGSGDTGGGGGRGRQWRPQRPGEANARRRSAARQGQYARAPTPLSKRSSSAEEDSLLSGGSSSRRDDDRDDDDDDDDDDCTSDDDDNDDGESSSDNYF